MLGLNARVGRIHALFCLISTPFLSVPTLAQDVPSNLSIYEELAINCLGPLARDSDSLLVVPPASMPYVTGALLTSWQDEGRVVFDSTFARLDAPLPILSWKIEHASVNYRRERRKMAARTVYLSLRYTVVSASGKLLEHDVCSEHYDDVVPRDRLPSLEFVAFPETRAEAPPAHWTRRYLEPVVLGTATALAAFLFFNLRSGRADS